MVKNKSSYYVTMEAEREKFSAPKEPKKKKKEKGKNEGKLMKQLKKRVKFKKVLKPSKTTFELKEHQPAEYVSRYFKDEMEEAEKSMFFS